MWQRAALAVLVLLPGMALAAPATHCDTDERPYFSCVVSKKPDSLDFFSHELIEFGDSVQHSKSHTPLLEIGDFANPIDKLYPTPDSAFH